MSNEQHRHLALELVDGPREVFRCLLIEIGQGFIEDQNLRPFQEGTGDGNALPLPARQSGTALADFRLVGDRDCTGCQAATAPRGSPILPLISASPGLFL